MKYIVSIILIIGMLFIGCGSTKQIEVVPQALPSWYTMPPHSDAENLYALGDGKSKKEALTNALNNLLATLSVSLSSSYNAKTVVREGTHTTTTQDATYENEVHAEVQKIRISNYEVLQEKKLGFNHYATLVRVEKDNLFVALKSDIDQKFSIFNHLYNSKATKYPLEKLKSYRNFIKEFQNIQNTLSVMSVLHPQFNQKHYIEKMAYIKKQSDDLHNAITFSFVATREAKKLLPVLSMGLSDAHYRIKNKKDKYHFTIYISLKIAYASSYGFHLARGVITVVTKDFHSVNIGTQTYNITGQSSQTKTIAKQDIAKRFAQLIKKKGIEKVLGII